jgi:hypothetical protein
MQSTWKGGGIPFGYSFDHPSNKLVINKFEEKILLLIYKLAEEGNTAGGIASRLQDLGIKSRKDKIWGYKSISLLLHPARIAFYAGKDKEGSTGDWAPIIDKARADKLIKHNSLLYQKTGRSTKAKFLLTGLNLANCGYCHGGVKSIYSRTKDHINYYYKCSNKEMYGINFCPESKLFRMEKVNQAVLNDILDQSLNKKNLIKINEAYYKQRETASNEKLKELNSKINTILGKQVNAGAENYQALNAELNKLLEEKNNLTLQKFERFEFDNLRNLLRFSIEKQRDLITTIIDKIVIYNNYLEINYKFMIDSHDNNTVRKDYTKEEIEK